MIYNLNIIIIIGEFESTTWAPPSLFPPNTFLVTSFNSTEYFTTILSSYLSITKKNKNNFELTKS